MTHAAKIIADSISPKGVRLTTMEITFPRIVLAEFNTHRMLSRNSASSRAIPVETMIRMVRENPYVPASWGKNQKGMQADEEVSAHDAALARDRWLEARDAATWHAGMLLELGIHKQLTNRLLEPFMWHTCIVTATEWDNLYHLRDHKDAHPDLRRTVQLMRAAQAASEPDPLDYDEWHLPYISPEDYDVAFGSGLAQAAGDSKLLQQLLIKVSTARCARVSYLTHDGVRSLTADITMHDERLMPGGHMSPFEHVARPATEDDDVFMLCKANEYNRSGPEAWFSGNFRGWSQYRKTIPNEHDKLNPQTFKET